ncbi:MAG: ABC transporter substrate-binding protein [Blautia marasmi]
MIANNDYLAENPDRRKHLAEATAKGYEFAAESG